MRKINNIIWFVYDFKSPGGGERWALEAERVFRDNGVSIQIVCKNFNKNVFFNGAYDLPVEVLSNTNINTNNTFSKIKGFFILITRLRKLIKKNKSKMVLCQGFREYVIVFFATLFSSAKYSIIDFGQIYHFEGIKIKYSFFYRKNLIKIDSILKNFGEKPEQNPPPSTFLSKAINEIKGFLIYVSYKYSENIFTLSDRVKNEDKLIYNKEATVIKGAYRKSILKIDNKVSNLELEKKPIIFTISRLIPNKRIDLCLEAINILREKNENFIFYIGGLGPELERLKEITKKLDLEKYVKFLGFVEESELIDYYLSCEFFTNMDHCDFDITSYMALALGKKVVCAKIMEIDANLSNNRHVFPVEPDPEKIALMYDMVLNKDIGNNTHSEEESLKQYTYEESFKKILDQFNKF